MTTQADETWDRLIANVEHLALVDCIHPMIEANQVRRIRAMRLSKDDMTGGVEMDRACESAMVLCFNLKSKIYGLETRLEARDVTEEQKQVVGQMIDLLSDDYLLALRVWQRVEQNWLSITHAFRELGLKQ